MLLQLYLIDNYEIIYLSIYFKMTDEKSGILFVVFLNTLVIFASLLFFV